MTVVRNLLVLLLLCLVTAAGAIEPAAAGTPLPADGGEPGKAVLAALEAQRAGDFEKWAEAMHPRMWQGKEVQLRKMLERMRKHSPLSARILGGRIEGERAIVQVEATFSRRTASTAAEGELLDGQWRGTRL